MSIDRAEAARALRDIGRTGRRTEAFSAYEQAGRSLVLWGFVWAAADALMAWRPGHAALIWYPALAIGAAASLVLRRSRGLDWRRLAAALVLLAAFLSMGLVVAPPTAAAWNALIALLAAAAYLLFGLWKGARFSLLGFMLGALTLVGYVAFRERFALWMAAVGGGGLVLGGFLLRKL